MFTNEQIREAMGSLVKTKGEDHTSFGRYADPTTGRGACFLGALCEHMGFAVPSEGTNARHVLGRRSVSAEMEVALQFAQFLNDRKFEWKYVLAGVDIILDRKITSAVATGNCPCGCDANTDFRALFDEVTHLRALDRSKMPKAPVAPAFAKGGFVSASATIKDIGGSYTIEFDISGLDPSLYTLLTGLSLPQVAVKKDHALVA